MGQVPCIKARKVNIQIRILVSSDKEPGIPGSRTDWWKLPLSWAKW